jgi:hypothetical protein
MEFFIHRSEVTYGTLVHEFGHLVAWHFAGRPEGNNFGCDMTGDKGVWSLKAEDLERDACCIEMALRLSHGEDRESITQRMIVEYSYDNDLEWVEEVGYMGGDKFMQEIFARGDLLLQQFRK